MATANVSQQHLFFGVPKKRIDVVAKQIGPGIVFFELKSINIKMIQTLTPVEPLVQKLSHYLFCPLSLGWALKLGILTFSVQVGRDVMIWNNKKFLREPIIVKEEKSIKIYRNWFKQFYTENSKPFEDAYSKIIGNKNMNLDSDKD
jgi:cholesterol 7-dehydrogenase